MTLATLLSDKLAGSLSKRNVYVVLLCLGSGFGILCVFYQLGADIHFPSVLIGITIFTVVRAIIYIGSRVLNNDDERDT